MLNMCINCGSISQNSPSSLLFNHSLVQRSQYSLNIARFRDERVPCTVNSVKIIAIFFVFCILYLFIKFFYSTQERLKFIVQYDHAISSKDTYSA